MTQIIDSILKEDKEMAKKRIASILLCFVLCITSIGMNTYAANKKKGKTQPNKNSIECWK